MMFFFVFDVVCSSTSSISMLEVNTAFLVDNYKMDMMKKAAFGELSS